MTLYKTLLERIMIRNTTRFIYSGNGKENL
jgi:hypothetical protein